MPFVPFNNVIRLDAIYSWDGQAVENVHHFLVDETPNVDTANSLASSYINWWGTEMRSLQANTLSLVNVVATIMETENDPVVEVSSGLPQSGTSVNNSMPNNVSVAISWKTNFRGRSYRGRTFHLGLTEAQVTGSTVDAGAVTALTNAYAELMALPVDVGPAILCVASRWSHGVLREQGVATAVTSVLVNNVVDSQRRRLPGRGR
jgi:hypothetical protein